MTTPLRCRYCGRPNLQPHRCFMWCRDCGAALAYEAARFAYVHPKPGADHPARPTTRQPEAIA